MKAKTKEYIEKKGYKPSIDKKKEYNKRYYEKRNNQMNNNYSFANIKS